jgi:plastocyanin/mono/diheme cytochrome c family protein
MRFKEALARFALVLILIGLPAIVILYLMLPRPAAVRVVEVRASVPQSGGFAPDNIVLQTGETVTLRFTAMDVTHGIAIGPGLGVDLGQIEPGHRKQITLTFDQPGTYTYYCTTWCSTDHWRMRGVIEVQSNGQALPETQPDPLIDSLVAEGIDIDAGFFSRGLATHQALDLSDISPTRGAQLLPSTRMPDALLRVDWRRTHTPAEAVVALQALNPQFTQKDLVDVVAHLWLSERDPVKAAAELYNQNCSACHGQSGNGDGPAALLIVKAPSAFANPNYMFHMRSDVLYAKIRRGGMGTDMPNFGTLFTPAETWAYVDYLWNLSLNP